MAVQYRECMLWGPWPPLAYSAVSSQVEEQLPPSLPHRVHGQASNHSPSWSQTLPLHYEMGQGLPQERTQAGQPLGMAARSARQRREGSPETLAAAATVAKVMRRVITRESLGATD